MSQILITGGTGLVGSKLVKRFDNVVVTSRNVTRARSKLGDDVSHVIEWNYEQGQPDLAGLQLKSVVNLMGESVAKGRWNAEKKKRLLDSRIIATQQLVEAIRHLDVKPEVMISASAVGYYGDRGSDSIVESYSAGSGFLAELAEHWEQAAHQVKQLGVRLVVLRIGVVLSSEGGALAEMLPIFKTGAGGRLGSGQQFFPWIHIDDLVKLIEFAINDSSITGVLNATAPEPVTNAEFTKALASTIRRPAFIPVPKFALKLAFGEFAETLFDSQRVIPEAALQAGFQYSFPNINDALTNLLS